MALQLPGNGLFNRTASTSRIRIEERASGNLGFLRTYPQFLHLRNRVRTMPELLEPSLRHISETNPMLVGLIRRNWDEFLNMLAEEENGWDAIKIGQQWASNVQSPKSPKRLSIMRRLLSRSWNIPKHFATNQRAQELMSRPDPQEFEGFGSVGTSTRVEELPGNTVHEIDTSQPRIPELSVAEVLDPEWVDTDILRQWISECNRNHRARCGYTKFDFGQGPTWLIDVESHHIISGNIGEPYAILSYVWGDSQCLQNTKATLEKLRTKDIFAKSDIRLQIPVTIRHAIQLTHILKLKYLWVDSLCIVQDDEESKHCELSRMAAIYEKADITIIAANGTNADHGLRGIKEVTDSKGLWRNGVNYLDCLQPWTNVWYTRGWTLQELLLSRRKIMFHHKTVVWECACNVWHEATGTRKFPDLRLFSPNRDDTAIIESIGEVPSYNPAKQFRFHFDRSPFPVNLESHFPDFRQYSILVWDYSGRKLGYPEDALIAFSAITDKLSKRFAGGFISGLPQLFFDVALIWQPLRPAKLREPRSPTATNICLPSWSWASWDGQFDPYSWVSGWRESTDSRRVDGWGRAVWLTNSITKWYYGFSPEECKPVVPLHDSESIAIYLGQYNGEDYPLRHNPPRPVPLLYCRTKTAILKSGQVFNRYGRKETKHPHYCLNIELIDEDGHFAGCLRLSRESEEAPRYELVAVSSGWLRADQLDTVDESSLATFATDFAGKPYEFYNVLWVEWRDGIAYRKALGRVLKRTWECKATTEMNLILG